MCSLLADGAPTRRGRLTGISLCMVHVSGCDWRGCMQVEGGFVQGMGWTCLEELVWGDEDHKWLPPGVLHTRGPGEHLPASPTPMQPCWKRNYDVAEGCLYL